VSISSAIKKADIDPCSHLDEIDSFNIEDAIKKLHCELVVSDGQDFLSIASTWL